MARVLVRTRLQEYFERILRDQMLASTNYIASFRSLQLSVILHGPAFVQSPDAMLGRATGILEVLTGQKPGMLKVDPLSTDPMVKDMSESERRESEKAASSAVLAKFGRNRPASSAKKIPSAATAGKNKKGAKGKAVATKSNSKVTDGEFKAAKSATQLCCDLHGQRMWYFLEKLREFYLPDVLASSAEQSTQSLRYGHDCTVPRKRLAGWFDIWTRALPGKPLRPVRQDENPEEAVATYILPTADLLRFPDIESFYERLASTGNHSIDGLSVIVRPTLRVATPMPKLLLEEQQALLGGWQPDKLVLMNWLLGHFFNPHMQRGHHLAAAPAPRFYPTDRPSFQ